ncbi:DUF4184 family protein [Micromonospora echinofusca]|uniref:DUF4184 family protein n=1 Tax=Micromonospora echinofusca TaxID=47858 RepID=A0ABS3W0R4_MICEH|nr:DUF4184 family protein [Micromonospora echinofusca]MBO4210381.1 DUF4184 family protein [Micromonospora echinofusca]
MPLTFPSHVAPVLPLKLWRPAWFDGVALVAGALAPDAAYLASGRHGHPFGDTHSWPGLLWWCLPVAVAYTWIVRRSAATVAVHLPAGGRFGWRRYGSLSSHRYPWWTTVTSALLGAATHLGWDRLTHTDGWVAVLLGRPWHEVSGIPWWTISDLTSTVLGALITIVLTVRVARHPRLLVSRGFAPVPPPADPRTFWWVAAGVLVVGLGVLPFLPAAGQPAPTIVRLLHLAALALLAGALATRVDPGVRSRR